MNAPHKPKKVRKTSSARRKGGNAWLAIEKWRKSLPKKVRKTSSARRKGGNAWLAIEKWRKSLPKKGQELPPIEQMLEDIGFVPHAH